MKINLYHTGYEIIKSPDIHYGRKNADFGQGFYMSDNGEFAGRWAKEKRGCDIIVNSYELDTEGLQVKEFQRDSEWSEYIFNNRAARDDYLKEYDVIIGPIANDTLFNTFGIITSGYLSRDEALQLLLVGPCYKQIVLKTTEAADRLKWLSAEVMDINIIQAYAKQVTAEEEDYQEAIAKVMEGF
ncbi:MAG: DUF3990 domain-containing protein [Pseudobutyrivibrio sp.]|nr:DUF3990 domain-containing protein [Pseudobutyrivibrio sp.]